MNSTYSLNSDGKSSYFEDSLNDLFHPLNYLYIGFTFCNTNGLDGNVYIVLLSSSYSVQTFISLNVSRTSDFVSAISVTPFIIIAYFNATRSSQPHLLCLPVVAPNSTPIRAISFPVSSKSSVGNGP